MTSEKADKKPRLQRGRTDRRVMFPVAPAAIETPLNYAAMLADLKLRIRAERLRVVLSSNAAMILLYRDIGQRILDKQSGEGWGSRVIDRLSADLREAFPDMKGFSPRNLKYMRSFAAAWPDPSIVQELLARLTWYHNIALLEKLPEAEARIWYARSTLQHGWSRNILALQIEGRAIERYGKAQNNFAVTLPPPDSDMAAQVFKDPYPMNCRAVCPASRSLRRSWRGGGAGL
jgi:predicted nuclease of restriction endonuclease-like (RecB) superfamily